jgi:glycosyltransferase involved in cell wall biosynthesis
MSRVLHLLPYLEAGGTERAVFTLAQALPSPWESRVLAPHGPLEKLFRDAGVLEPDRGSFGRSLKDTIERWRPDLLHIHAATHFFFRAKKTNLPIVFTGHGYPTSFDYWLSSTLSNRWAKKVISVSCAEEKRFLDSGLKGEKSVVIYNGIFQPQSDPDRSRQLFNELGLTASRPILAMAARLVPDKGIGDLLAALALLPQRPQLVLAGTGPMEGELKRMTSQLGLEEDVFLPGYLEHPEDLLSLAQIAVLPSWRESLGLFLLEAMAMGKAIVATEVGGIPEALGDSGLLVPARDPQRLAQALGTLLENKSRRQELGRKSKQRWQELFSAQRMGQLTSSLYNEALGK